ncbi:MAG: hypothetical protein KDA66_10045, partial [Planctomycetaceae bacterium]|nr:hypothetical protein [Planctomycetaceae bacterium]
MARSLAFCATLFGALLSTSFAAPETGADAEKLQASTQRGVEFLKSAQAADGSWTSPAAPGISGLVTYSLLESGASVDDPVVKKALAHLESFVQKDGGIYHPETNHKNYETSIILLALN